MKRISTLLIIATLFVASLFAQTEINGIYYNLNDETKTAEVTSNSNKYSGDITIPEKVTYNSTEYSVTSIGNSAFYYCSSLTSITIPNSVTSIGNEAFRGCSSLTSITIPNSITKINYYAFSSCSSLTSITIPNSVTSIGDHALESCKSLTSITIPNSVTSIGGYAFRYCSSLTSITIPNSVTSIGNEAFGSCSSLTSITIPNSVTSIGDHALESCSSLTSITIPNSVTSIGDHAFESCSSLTSITIPNSVTSIGSYAFYNCSSLTSITIPNSVTSIESYAFSSCSSLTSITIPNSVTSIERSAFSSCSSLTSITIPNSVTSIGSYAFSHCSFLTAINVDTNNQKYASIDGVLYNKNITNLIYCPNGKTSIIIPNSVTSIGDYAFYKCEALTSITIPNSVTSIGNEAFRGCSSLTSITIPNSITKINYYAFSSCSSLSSITIGNSVTSIGEGAFSDCSSLTSITIPNSVTSIGYFAFQNCHEIKTINIHTDNLENYCKSNVNDRIFANSYSTGNSAAIRHLFINGVEITELNIPENITSISDYAFYNCDAITSVTIPNSVTSIGNYAFRNCSSLKSITIPNSVTSIGNYTFYNCSSLASITIPNSVTSIGNYAFYNCSSLASITIPNSVTSIGNYAFSYCSSLTSITIPNSVTSIGERAFYYCRSLTSITIPNSVTSIGYYAFYNCRSLTSITIGNSVTSIGNYAFSNCYSLTSINIEATIPPTIGGANTFNNVSKNIPVTVPCGSLSAYQSASYWSEFTNFVETPFPYTFSATTADATMGSVTIETAPACGVDAVIKATPKAGYAFEKWSDGNTDNPRTIAVTQNTSLTAQFKDGLIASGTCGDNLTWVLSQDYTLTISGSGDMYNYNYLSDVPWYSYRKNIKEVIVSNGVKSIGNYAFDECSNLKSIILPSSLTTIGNKAFVCCYGLTSITIPNNVTSIGVEAFLYCKNLKIVDIPNSVTTIKISAFKGCESLTSIILPQNLTQIANSTFEGCSSLNSITIPEKVTTIGAKAFRVCYALTTVDIPNSVTSIGDEAFSSCFDLSYVTIPNNLKSIGYSAFSNTDLAMDLVIPNSVTYIGDQAFRYCYYLKSLIIPNSVTYIGEFAFASCSGLTSLSLPDNLKTIRMCAFSHCYSLKEIIIPNSVTTIEEGAFCVCDSLVSLTLPNNLTTIGNSAFSGCSNLTNLVIPQGVKIIGAYAFSGCTNLTDFTIPNGVTTIEEWTFEGCKNLNNIFIPQGITKIKDYAFYNCSSLSSINLSQKLDSIGYYAFSECSSLTSISLNTVIPPVITSYSFHNIAKTIAISIPCNSITAYMSDKYWSEFTNYMTTTFPFSLDMRADEVMGSVLIETDPDCGVDAVIKATPNAGYKFTQWSDGNTDNPRTITVTKNISLTAEFEKLPSKYYVSVQPNNPTMGMVVFISGTNNTEYEIGSSVTVIAAAYSGYTFKGWSDGVSDAMRTIVVNEDISLTAIFEAPVVNYTLTLTADNTMGSVTGSGTYTKGTTATIIATPNAGYRFVKWSDGNTNATRSIIMNEDMTLSAIFEKIPTFTINVTANAQMGSATGGGTFETGKSTTLSAIANEGYHFVKWSDGVTTNPRNITVTENLSLEAIFEALYPNWSFDDDKPSSTEHTFLGKQYYDTITIVAGKTITIEDNAIIACNDIIIKADENGNVPEIKIEGDIIANNGITFEWEIDDSRWYFFTLPFNCKIRDVNLVTIANGPSDGVWNYYNTLDGSGDFIIRDYNQKRAAQGQGKKTGWVDCEENKMLHKGRGYIIGLFPADSKAKLHFKSEKQIQLSKFIEYELDFGEGHSWYDYAEGDNQLYNGWNLIGVPYFETFSQGDLDATYVSIPNNDGTTYTQHTLAEALTQGLLRPFKSFFIQLAENVAPTFDPTDRSNAPILRAKQNAEGGEIVVNILKAEDEELCDRTTIINNTSKTNDYEIGYDLQKMIGHASRPQIYTIEECGLLAFNAQDVMASGIVRLGLYVPADGEYIIGGESWGAMSGAELYDIESDEATSLTIPQTIYLTKGTHDERFIIRVKQQVTTNAENNNDSEVNAYIENGRLIIENMPADGNVYVYDTAGKLVHQQSTNSNINVELIAEGIYHITIHTVNNQVINTKVVY